MASSALPWPGMHDDGLFLVAEIGKNFIQTEESRPLDDYIATACALIDAAKDAGADAVKFQTHTVDDEQLPIPITSPHSPSLDRHAWVRRNTEATPAAFWDAVTRHSNNRAIRFFSTPMSRASVERLRDVNPPFWKVASSDVTDFVLLDALAKTGKPVILSTGMSGPAELDAAVRFLQKRAVPLAILYCVSQYPCPPEEFNLATLDELRDAYPDVTIGFSDHSLGHDVTVAAVQRGAKIIEKHFSFSRDLWGPDHKVSMTPQEFAAMAVALRAASPADTTPYDGEPGRPWDGATNAFRPYFHKSLVAAQDIPAGTVLTEQMIMAVRPFQEEALPASQFPDTVGRVTLCDLHRYDLLTADSLR